MATDYMYGQLTPRRRPGHRNRRQGWFFRSTTEKVGTWRDIKNGNSGSTYSGRWERLYTSPTFWWLYSAIDRRTGVNSLGKGDWGSSLFWKESYEILSRDVPFIKCRRASSVVYEDFEGHLYPSAGAWGKVNTPTKPVPLWKPFTSEFAVSTQELRTMAASAISKLLPGVPPADVATSIAELREGLPKVVGAQLFNQRSFSNAGGEYLNYQFGIAPTIKDVKSILAVTANLEEELAKAARYSDKDVRRRRTLVDDTTTETIVTTGASPYYGGPMTVYTIPTGTHTKTTVQHRKVWYSGAFRQRPVPAGAELFEGVRAFNRAYGSKPSLLTFWNISPYSWLLDWFSNTGDVLKYIANSGTDGWYQRYGYVMAETTAVVTETWRGTYAPYANAGPKIPVISTVSYVQTVKQRVRASPYVFGWDAGALTSYQKSILAALGMSRMGSRI